MSNELNRGKTAADDTAAPIDVSEFRWVMRNIPTSVAVVAGFVKGEPVGMLVGSFAAISRNPPLVGFFGDVESTTLEILLASKSLGFSLLHDSARDVSHAFRRAVNERFKSIDWSMSDLGNPVVTKSTLIVEGEVTEVIPVGDHRLVIVKVLAARLCDWARRPLIYYDRVLDRLDPYRGASSPARIDWSF